MVQWLEHSAPTIVARVRFPVSASYVGLFYCFCLYYDLIDLCAVSPCSNPALSTFDI